MAKNKIKIQRQTDRQTDRDRDIGMTGQSDRTGLT